MGSPYMNGIRLPDKAPLHYGPVAMSYAALGITNAPLCYRWLCHDWE